MGSKRDYQQRQMFQSLLGILKSSSWFCEGDEIYLFQSLLGILKSRSFSLSVLACCLFQSLLGILKSGAAWDEEGMINPVSIPPRYSKIMRVREEYPLCFPVSIPPRYSKITLACIQIIVATQVSIPPRYSKILSTSILSHFQRQFQSLLGILKSGKHNSRTRKTIKRFNPSQVF